MADFTGMRSRSEFGRILDELLEHRVFASASPAAGDPATTWRPAPQPVFLFGDLDSGFTAGPASRRSVTSGASPWTPVYDATREARPRRRPRLLTSEQSAALEALRSLGARALTSEFTDVEIKSAFRTLARQFHPDRHPHSSEADRARLSRAFATACDAYRTLTTAVH